MAVLNKDSFTATVKGLVGDRTDDDALKALEDLTDTFNSYSDSEDWKTKFEANDKEWRERYKARFLEGSDTEDANTKSEDKDEDDAEDITVDDLFEDEDKKEGD